MNSYGGSRMRLEWRSEKDRLRFSAQKDRISLPSLLRAVLEDLCRDSGANLFRGIAGSGSIPVALFLQWPLSLLALALSVS
jgi:hypothetical protein